MSLLLSLQDFIKIYPGAAESSEIYNCMEKRFPHYALTTKVRIAGFLSQVGHESEGMADKSENLNYSAKALRSVFSKYFRHVNADDYARQPEKIANYVYANRMGNGPPGSDDGWRYRGRGFIQLTGKNNYTSFARDMNMSVDEAIEFLQTTEGALESALWFWHKNRLNLYADNRDVKGMTQRINGGFNGLNDRAKYWNYLLDAMDDRPVTENAARNIILKLGSRGDEVAKLQRALGLGADGVFGPKTEKEVKKFQKINKLTVDGIAGSKTLAKVYR